MTEIVIVGAKRTPIGSFQGQFAGLSSIDLGAAAIRAAVDQAGIDLFLVPAAQSESDIAAARLAAPNLEIVPVATLEEAIGALVAAGGSAPVVSSASSVG